MALLLLFPDEGSWVRPTLVFAPNWLLCKHNRKLLQKNATVEQQAEWKPLLINESNEAPVEHSGERSERKQLSQNEKEWKHIKWLR